MKKVFFLLAVVFCISLVSCTQNDCVCTANQEKSTSGANSMIGAEIAVVLHKMIFQN